MLTVEVTCAAHRPVDTRGSAARRGYGADWTRYSLEYRELHPWCRACEAEGRRTPTALVDHIEPVTGPDDPRFWPETNHQPLCRSCHAIKTASEGRTNEPAPAPWFAC